MSGHKKMMGVTVVICVGIAFLGGCCRFEKKVCRPEPTLIGSWKLKNQGNGPATTLTFREDQTFQVDIGGDGVADIWGTYDLYGNRLKLTDTRSGGTTDCLHSGFYNYTINGRELSFEVFAEECAPRREILTTGWESMAMIPQNALREKEVSKVQDHQNFK